MRLELVKGVSESVSVTLIAPLATVKFSACEARGRVARIGETPKVDRVANAEVVNRIAKAAAHIAPA